MKTHNPRGTGLARAAAVLFVLLLQGCQTAYQPRGLTGGYSEQRIANDVYYVTFGGNGHTPKEVVERLFVYRCAELTKEKGYKYFVVLRTNRSGALDMPRMGGLDQAGPWRKAGFDPDASGGGFRQVKGGGGGYYYVPGGSYYVTTWTGRATIRMLNDINLLTRTVGYVAEDVMRQVGPYVRDRTRLVDMPAPAILDPVLGVVPLKPAPEPVPGMPAPAMPAAPAPDAPPNPPNAEKAI